MMDVQEWLHEAQSKHMTPGELQRGVKAHLGHRVSLGDPQRLLMSLPLPELAYVVILPGGPPWCVQIHQEDVRQRVRSDRMIGHAHNSTVGRAIVQAWLDYKSRQER